MPVFKRGDDGFATNYRPISFASCCFKLFEHLVHSRIGPSISSQLDVCQGGFRWVLMCWSVHSLKFCHHADLLSHSLFSWTSRKRLTQRGLRALWSASMRWGTGQMWHLMCHFLRNTQSQVRVGASLSAPWQDSGIAQGRVLSPMLFNLLIDTLASDVRQLAPGVRLVSHHRFSNKLYADDLVVVAVSTICRCAATLWQCGPGSGASNLVWDPANLQPWCLGPARLVPICAVTLAGVPLPQVSEFPNLGVTLTSSLTWVPHIRKLIARGNRLFAQCVSWCRSEHLPLVFASNLFHTYVLPSVLWGAEFCSGSVPAVRLLDGAIRRWSDVCWGGLAGLPSQQFTWNLAGLTRRGSSQVGCCPSSGASLPCPSEIVLRFQPLCLVQWPRVPVPCLHVQ